MIVYWAVVDDQPCSTSCKLSYLGWLTKISFHPTVLWLKALCCVLLKYRCSSSISLLQAVSWSTDTKEMSLINYFLSVTLDWSFLFALDWEGYQSPCGELDTGSTLVSQRKLDYRLCYGKTKERGKHHSREEKHQQFRIHPTW